MQPNKGGDKKPGEGEKETKIPGVLVRVRVNGSVPVGHAVVVGLERKIEEWDTIL